MKVFGRMTVFPIMPSRISRLYELAYNLWWSWHPEARALYRKLDPALWEHVGHNPVHFLHSGGPTLCVCHGDLVLETRNDRQSLVRNLRIHGDCNLDALDDERSYRR